MQTLISCQATESSKAIMPQGYVRLFSQSETMMSCQMLRIVCCKLFTALRSRDSVCYCHHQVTCFLWTRRRSGLTEHRAHHSSCIFICRETRARHERLRDRGKLKKIRKCDMKRSQRAVSSHIYVYVHV